MTRTCSAGLRAGLLVSAFLTLVSFAHAQELLEQRAQDIARQVAAAPKVEASWFDPQFLRKVSTKKLAQILASLHEQYGPATSMVLRGSDSEFSGRYEMTSEKDFVIPVSITLQSQPPHAIVGLWFGQATAALKDFDAVVAELAKLPGRTGLSCRELGEGEGTLVAEKDADEPLAIGSAFKLYVLGALGADVEGGKRKLEDVTRIDPRWTSLPSGRMHTWPAGAPVTLSTLAIAMISESDNTATDHLMGIVSRGACEAILGPMGSACAEQNRPFLTTREMFQLKLTRGGALAEAYVKLDEAGRRKMLAEDLSGGLSKADVDLSLMGKPFHIDTIEWFASPRDMNRAMDALRRAMAPGKKAHALREALAVNPGIPALKDVFEWVGFKGGSETGVIDLTFLLKSKDGRWFALSAAWNDPSAAVDEERFVALVGRAGSLLAREAAASGK